MHNRINKAVYSYNTDNINNNSRHFNDNSDEEEGDDTDEDSEGQIAVNVGHESAFNEQRVIAHIDLDCFYVEVERRNENKKGKTAINIHLKLKVQKF